MTPINSGHLIWWLRQQLDEDAAVAREATPGPWIVTERTGTYGGDTETHWGVRAPDELRVVNPAVPEADQIRFPVDVVAVESDRDYNMPQGGCESQADAAHIARHDPGSVLADIDAKRRIVDRCEVALGSPMGDELYALERYFALYVLRELATAYEGRDGFDEGWTT